MNDCLACESIAAGTAPGGCIHETSRWFVDHCVGPLGVGTLIVKPKRHVVHVADLEDSESGELGGLLRRASAVVTDLLQPDQVYLTLWSHAGGVPVHIHFVVQPVTKGRMDEYGFYGPRLQVEMFGRNVAPDPHAATAFAECARAAWPS